MQLDRLEAPIAAEPSPKDLAALARDEFCRAASLALKDGSIWPAFQPIVSLRDRLVVGFEILARWSHPVLGIVPPDRFIPRFEDYDLIDSLTERLLKVAASQLKALDNQAFIAINIAPGQLLRPDLPERIVTIAASAGIAPQRIEIEITENALIQDPVTSLSTLRAMYDLGMKISIDDFGTGYSNLSRLESFPFHKLKIDARFIRGIDVEAGRRRIVAAIIGLGQSLGISLVAEGIETEEQARIVGELGCGYGQGWLFGRPEEGSKLPKMAAGLQQPVEVPLVDRSPFQQFHQLQTLYDQAPVGLCFLDLNYRYVQVNDLFASMHHRRQADLLGKTIDDIMDQELLGRVRSVIEHAWDSDERLDHVYHLHGRVYRVLGNKVRDISGEMIGFSFVSLDITEQTKLIAELEERDRHYRHLVELGPNIGWAADVSGKVDYMSPLGDSCAEEPMEERIARWYARVHPDDGARVRSSWLQHLPSGKPFHTRFRILWEDGAYREVLSRAVPHFDEHGRVVRWYGVISEIPQ